MRRHRVRTDVSGLRLIPASRVCALLFLLSVDEHGGAQVAPKELCTKLIDAALANGAELRIGSVEGIETEDDPEGGRRLRAVKVDGESVEASKMVVTMCAAACRRTVAVMLPCPPASHTHTHASTHARTHARLAPGRPVLPR